MAARYGHPWRSVCWLVALPLVACSAMSNVASNRLAADLLCGKTEPFRTILVGDSLAGAINGNLDVVEKVFTSAEDVSRFWQQDVQASGAPDRQIDFSKELAILVRDRVYGGGYHDLEIVSIVDDGKALTVNAVSWAGCEQFTTDGFSQPGHLVAIPKTDKPIVFAAIVSADSCARPSCLPLPTPGVPAAQ